MFVLKFVFICAAAAPAFAGTPLILTPLVKQNHTEEARNRSVVDPTLFLGLASYSGFLTVDEKHDSNLFFWYFPKSEPKVEHVPWILWIHGDVGVTSLAGLFTDIGPFSYLRNETRFSQGGSLIDREFSWYKYFAMVFLDSSVAEGFSFTDKNLNGIPKDEDMLANHLLKAVEQLVQIYPELSKAPLYIAGTDFAGHSAPALATKIMQSNFTTPINLQGIILGNPLLDADNVKDYISVFYDFGLVDQQGALAAKPLQDKFIQALDQKLASSANSFREDLLNKLRDMSGKIQLHSAVKDYMDLNYYFMDYITKSEVREALHVGNLSFSITDYSVITYMKGEFLNNVTTKIEKLLERYRVLIYCGQTSLVTPCVPYAEARRRWHWKHRDDFLQAPRLPWWYNDSLVGYIKSGGNLMEIMFLDTGNLVSLDKPGELLHLVKNFINNRESNFILPPNFSLNKNYTAPYVEASIVDSNDRDIKLTISIVVNIVLILMLLLGVVLFLRFKKKIKQLYGPVSEGAMNMR